MKPGDYTVELAIGDDVQSAAVTILAVLPGVPAAALFAWFVLGMVTVLSVRRIQKRSQFYQTILLLASPKPSVRRLLQAPIGTTNNGAGAEPGVSRFSPP